MQPQGTSVATQPDATRGSGANRNHGERVGALSTAPRDAASTSGSSPTQAPQARAPNATSQHRWGGVYPKPTLLLSVRGCEWGSRPLSSDFHPTSQTRAMRVQVRLAAPGEHRGGFGTCGRGARAIPRRTKILGRPHGPATRDPVEASAARTLRSQVASSGTRPPADHGPRTARPWQGRAQYDPSRGPVTQTGPGADTITNQDERPHGHPAGQVARPARTNRSQAPAGTRAARTPPRPSDSDRATARERTIPPAGTNGPQAFLPDKILGPPRARHCRAPVGTRTALTLPRSGDSERATLARTQTRRRAASLEPARA